MSKKPPPGDPGNHVDDERPKRRRGRALLFAPAAALAALLAGSGASSASSQLPVILADMNEIDRIGVIAESAVSRSPRVRLAIARALRQAPPAIGSVTAIEHLSRDPDPRVRVAIAEAAWLRRGEDPTRLIAVLERLAADDEPSVREVAHLALGGPTGSSGMIWQRSRAGAVRSGDDR